MPSLLVLVAKCAVETFRSASSGNPIGSTANRPLLGLTLAHKPITASSPEGACGRRGRSANSAAVMKRLRNIPPDLLPAPRVRRAFAFVSQVAVGLLPAARTGDTLATTCSVAVRGRADLHPTTDLIRPGRVPKRAASLRVRLRERGRLPCDTLQHHRDRAGQRDLPPAWRLSPRGSLHLGAPLLPFDHLKPLVLDVNGYGEAFEDTSA
jgi:hypothetical protein